MIIPTTKKNSPRKEKKKDKNLPEDNHTEEIIRIEILDESINKEHEKSELPKEQNENETILIEEIELKETEKRKEEDYSNFSPIRDESIEEEKIYTDRFKENKQIFDNFWSNNLNRETKWFEEFLSILFPCCIGNPFSSVRLKDYLRFLTSFIFWVSIAEFVYLIVEIIHGIHPLSMFYHPNPSKLSLIMISLGAKYSYGIKNSYEVFRLFSAVFMHSDFVHLFLNLTVQLTIVLGYERSWAFWKIAIIYITCGAFGNLVSACVYPNVVTVGASGSLLGVIMAKLAEVFCRWTDYMRNERLIHILSIVFIVFIIGTMSFSSTVDWGSHLGGAISGFLLGFIFFSWKIKKNAIKTTVFFFTLILYFAIFFTLVLIFVFYVEAADLTALST